MEKEVEGTLDAAKRVETKMENVSRLMNTFTSLVTEQQETIANLYDLTEETATSIDKSGEELGRAAGKRATFPIFFNAIVLSAAALLLLVHALHP